MSDRLPGIPAGKVAKVLEHIGFELVRQSGSHRIYRNEEGQRVTLPFHYGKDIASQAAEEHSQRCGYFGGEVEGIAVNSCPPGRPTIIHLDGAKLERIFV